MSKNQLLIYVGNPEESFDDHLYVDLVVRGRHVTLGESKQSIDYVEEEVFQKALEGVLNTATIYSTELKLPIVVGDSLIDSIEAFESKSVRKNLKELLKEVVHVDEQ